VDATRGVRDYADDLAATIAALGLTSVHLVGWSMGGGVVLQYLVDRPGTHRLASLTLVDPGIPVRVRRYPGCRLPGHLTRR
jgi:pimeloyl-ACP methyl ester carboxylesterase